MVGLGRVVCDIGLSLWRVTAPRISGSGCRDMRTPLSIRSKLTVFYGSGLVSAVSGGGRGEPAEVDQAAATLDK